VKTNKNIKKGYTMNKLLILLSALIFTFAMAAESKCGTDKNKTEMKCEAGKCAGDVKKDMKMKCEAGKCGGDMKKEAPKVPTKAKCGQGKCGQ
jgi:uncharacterized low-complexity protein